MTPTSAEEPAGEAAAQPGGLPAAAWLLPPRTARLPDAAAALLRNAPDRAAAVELQLGGQGPAILAWRRAYLDELVRNGVVPATADPACLLRAAGRHALVHRPGEPRALAAAPGRGQVVLLVSRFGIERFGGAEHFLQQMGRLYRDQGYAPLVVGMRPGRAGEDGLSDGLRYRFVEPTPDALFRLAREESAAIAHVVSGLGFEVAAALRYLDVRIVFGVHFWRELFHPPTAATGWYPDCPEGYDRRAEFQLLLADADAVYANSAFTRQVILQAFDTAVGIVPSLPDDVPAAMPASPRGRDIVLLANARADKGFGLLLRIAARLPDQRFVAIAGQSPPGAAREQARRAGLDNVEVIERVDDLGPLYSRACAVLVPSYRFVETFSRVVIEAQRQGVPVIGSDRGNVPVLLRGSGVSLPEDPVAWAEELRRLRQDPAYWTARSRRALDNAESHPFAAQAGRLRRLIAGLDAPILVAVGSGLGNIVHATPLLRNLSRRLGRPVDVVVAGDSAGATAVVANAEHVRHVFPLADPAVRRRYHLVFVTQSFGALVPAFRAERVVESRAWQVFTAAHPLHEAEFNLAAAQALIGVPYDPEDVREAFVGDLAWPGPPAATLVGLHAGSKGGVWAAKRWPHFADLAARLSAAGIRVASFGLPDEHVPGTLDLTGGSVEETARAMLRCSAFVANDSGLMNLANAMGVPLIALFGPTEPRTRGPLRGTSLALALDKPCAPCEHAGPRGPFATLACRCIAELPVALVERTLRDLLDGSGRPVAQADAAD